MHHEIVANLGHQSRPVLGTKWRLSIRSSGMLLALLMLLGLTHASTAQDWPQWNGPTRDGMVPKADIVTVIPEDGLEKIWTQPVRLGYSGPAIANGRVVVSDYDMETGEITNRASGRDRLTGRERVLCFDASNGDVLWEQDYDCEYLVAYPSGPRATPTIHDGRVYALGTEGNLLCIDLMEGDVIWERNFKEEFGAVTPLWGHSASPLVYEETLVCMVGGEDSLVVAFELATGEEVWRALNGEDVGYCPPSLINSGGVEQLLIWDPKNVHSLNPTNGEEYWRESLEPGYGMSILPPLKDGNLLFVSGESATSAMYRLSEDRPAVEVVWRGTPRSSIHLATGSAVFSNGYLYGCDSRSGALICADAEDGTRVWQSTVPTLGIEDARGMSHGSAFLLKVDEESFLILSETGDIVSATLTPDGYNETGRFHAIDPTGRTGRRNCLWTYPAIADQKLYIRNDEEIVCYSLAPQ